LIPNEEFDRFLSLFGEVIDKIEFKFYENDESQGPEFKTGIRNGMRSAILRLEGHIPFQNKASFHEGKIVFKVHYRDINIKKTQKVSPKKMLQEAVGPQQFFPKLEQLKTVVTSGNPIHPDYLRFCPQEPNLGQFPGNDLKTWRDRPTRGSRCK
jgi:hypothetical protein